MLVSRSSSSRSRSGLYEMLSVLYVQEMMSWMLWMFLTRWRMMVMKLKMIRFTALRGIKVSRFW